MGIGAYKMIVELAKTDSSYTDMANSLENTRAGIASLFRLADTITEKCNLRQSGVDLGTSVRIDFFLFALYISSSDGKLDTEEVDSINYFLGTNFSEREVNENFTKMIAHKDAFAREIPVSIAQLMLVTKEISGSRELADFGKAIVETYRMLGGFMALADKDFDEKEKKDVANYVDMLQRFVSTF